VKKLPAVLMFVVLFLVVLNIVVLRQLSSVQARLDKLEKQVNAGSVKVPGAVPP
jgi:uncharacterized protein YoxC